MSSGPRDGEQKIHRPEKAETHNERSALGQDSAACKSFCEADAGMEQYNKSIVAQVTEKRLSRKSGATKNGLASADVLLPLDDPNKAPAQDMRSDGQTRDVLMQLAGQAFISDAAKRTAQIVENGNSFVGSMGKGIGEAAGDLINNVAIAADYYGKTLTGKADFGADAQQFARSLSDGSAQALGIAADYYLKRVPIGQNNLGKDIGETAQTMTEHWNSMDWEKKGHFIGKEIVPFGVAGAVGVIAKDVQVANLLGKAGEAVSSLADSEKLAEIERKIIQLQEKAARIKQMLKPQEPAYATSGEARPHLGAPKDSGKPEHIFEMSKSGEYDELPKRAKAENESVLESYRISEKFQLELKHAIDGLAAGERGFLEKSGIEIKAVRRLPDVLPGKEKLGACYSPEHKTIFVPEEIMKYGTWVPNDDIQFALRHEFGHVFNAKFDLSASLSDDPAFIAAYKKDHAKLSQAKLDELQLSGRSAVDARDEVFADMYGHASAKRAGIQAKSAYSTKLKEAFGNCLKYLEEF